MIRDNEDMINVFDVERIFGDLPLDIIKENVKSQIEDPLVFISNQCEDVYETFDEAFEEFGHIDEYRQNIIELKEDFSIFILQELDRKYNLGVDFDNLQDYENYLSLYSPHVYTTKIHLPISPTASHKRGLCHIAQLYQQVH